VVTVRLQTAPARCSVAFGAVTEVQTAERGQLAIFAPDKVVAYAVRCSPWQALYLFRTSATAETATRLKGVSAPVNLLYVATTRRTVGKTLSALHGLRRRIGDRGIDELPDLFWLRLADFIERRGQKILCYAAQLLERGGAA
jgi:hypothetical protein